MTRAESVVLALEACVKAGRPVSSDWYGNDSGLLHQFSALAAAAEREACAKVCDDIDVEYGGEDVVATWCSAAIRARGNT
jgi:hypothetical protein